MNYWLIKTLLVVALIIVTYLVIKPPKTASSLAVRRIGMLLVLASAAVAIVFPEVFNGLARAIGVQSGLNLVVYLLVVALFAQMATSYQRDAAAEAKLTELARQVALQRVDPPEETRADKEAPDGDK